MNKSFGAGLTRVVCNYSFSRIDWALHLHIVIWLRHFVGFAFHSQRSNIACSCLNCTTQMPEHEWDMHTTLCSMHPNATHAAPASIWPCVATDNIGKEASGLITSVRSIWTSSAATQCHSFELTFFFLHHCSPLCSAFGCLFGRGASLSENSSGWMLLLVYGKRACRNVYLLNLSTVTKHSETQSEPTE